MVLYKKRNCVIIIECIELLINNRIYYKWIIIVPNYIIYSSYNQLFTFVIPNSVWILSLFSLI
jgi:hypothetical protein